MIFNFIFHYYLLDKFEFSPLHIPLNSQRRRQLNYHYDVNRFYGKLPPQLEDCDFVRAKNSSAVTAELIWTFFKRRTLQLGSIDLCGLSLILLLAISSSSSSPLSPSRPVVGLIVIIVWVLIVSYKPIRGTFFESSSKAIAHRFQLKMDRDGGFGVT